MDTSAPPPVPRFLFTEKTCDLFESDPSACLAHCVSRDLKMGAGIAVLFKKKVGRMNELKIQAADIGECAILDYGNRFIYNMVTKSRYFQKPTYDSVRAALIFMRDRMVANDMTQLCMPRIACGLDKLVWGNVRQMIIEEFQNTNISVTVCQLE